MLTCGHMTFPFSMKNFYERLGSRKLFCNKNLSRSRETLTHWSVKEDYLACIFVRWQFVGSALLKVDNREGKAFKYLVLSPTILTTMSTCPLEENLYFHKTTFMLLHHSPVSVKIRPVSDAKLSIIPEIVFQWHYQDLGIGFHALGFSGGKSMIPSSG